ncbi:MAG: AAA family ATPase [Alphaproteobacteria bacterium]|nr:AAA family ATPase [Alphaproteobacteria bacterium]
MIETLTLTDFRNHTMCRIKTHGRRNVIIIGPNGAGKTAILEALSILSGDRGMRGAQMGEIARFGGNGGFSVFATLSDETELAVSFSAGDTNRRAKIDGDNAPLVDLTAYLPMVWITPREDRLFVDSAADRRAFFDRLVASFDATHSGRVARFTKLLSERAIALKSGRDMRWVDVLDDQIAATAVAIADARIKYAGELNYFLENCAVSVSGMIEQMLIDGRTPGDAERTYREYLGQTREIIADKMVVDGVHKSDFGVFNKKLNLPAHLTSTGQQKTALMELILAHAKLLHTRTNRRPFILLDEAVAHLDTNAREKLFSELGKSDAQVWATGLDASVFDGILDAVIVSCTDGDISNILVS